MHLINITDTFNITFAIRSSCNNILIDTLLKYINKKTFISMPILFLRTTKLIFSFRFSFLQLTRFWSLAIQRTFCCGGRPEFIHQHQCSILTATFNSISKNQEFQCPLYNVPFCLRMATIYKWHIHRHRHTHPHKHTHTHTKRTIK